MKRFIKYVVIIVIMAVFLLEAVVLGILRQKKGVFDSSYQSVIVDKYRMLQKTDERKIIIVSGSSSSFGLDQNKLQEMTGYKIVNLGLHAGFGQLFPSELSKENINPGDIVLLGYEYNWINGFETLGQELIMTGVDDNIDLYRHIPVRYWPDFIGYLFKYAQKKNEYTGASGIYSREAFDDNGQMTMRRDYAMSDYYDKIDLYGHISVLDSDGNVTISENSIKYLQGLKRYVEERGASIYFISSPILYESITCQVEDFFKLSELEEEKIGIPYISDPRMYMFPLDLMSNAVNHCNSEGEKIRTSILIDDLQLCGAIEKTRLTNITKMEYGETFALVDELPNRFLHKPEKINHVYRVNDEGSIIEYIEGIDYTIDFERGTIRRTENSAIPNYKDHHVKYSSGKFKYISDKENYNPESNRSYQILVDYSYYVSENELNSISNQSKYLSERLRNKILNGENIDIALYGDSIGAGADTNGQGVFLNYLAKELENYYGLSVTSKRFSSGKQNQDLLQDDLESIINKHPDVLMIEFGMYNHASAEELSEEEINEFSRNIDRLVALFQKNEIDVIIVGFFQQNMTFDKENVNATILYNDVLRNIAQQREVYFADIYNTFERVGRIKHLSRDVLADFISHPTEWGHKLYFSSIIDVFNIDGGMNPVDMMDYVNTF